MTIRDLKAQLSNLDDDTKISLQKSDGTQMEITKASKQGDQFTFWTDNSG